MPRNRHDSLYRIGTLSRIGVPFAFGSDAPVELPNPLLELYGAVARISKQGHLLGGGERISIEEALRAHTVGGARSSGWTQRLGSLSPGMIGDLVLLDRDPTKSSTEELLEIRILATVVGGDLWRSSEFEMPTNHYRCRSIP